MPESGALGHTAAKPPSVFKNKDDMDNDIASFPSQEMSLEALKPILNSEFGSDQLSITQNMNEAHPLSLSAAFLPEPMQDNVASSSMNSLPEVNVSGVQECPQANTLDGMGQLWTEFVAATDASMNTTQFVDQKMSAELLLFKPLDFNLDGVPSADSHVAAHDYRGV